MDENPYESPHQPDMRKAACYSVNPFGAAAVGAVIGWVVLAVFASLEHPSYRTIRILVTGHDDIDELMGLSLADHPEDKFVAPVLVLLSWSLGAILGWTWAHRINHPARLQRHRRMGTFSN
jgi:hypothetical protein